MLTFEYKLSRLYRARAALLYTFDFAKISRGKLRVWVLSAAMSGDVLWRRECGPRLKARVEEAGKE